MKVKEGSKTDLKKTYPLCYKYKAPCHFIPEKGWRFTADAEVASEWVATLPHDRVPFWKVMGHVTYDEWGYYLCDIEDTLYALERRREQRGGF